MPSKDFSLPGPLVFFDGVQTEAGAYFAVREKGERIGETVFVRKTSAGWELLGDVPWPAASMCAGGTAFRGVVAVSAEGELVRVDDRPSESFALGSAYSGEFTARRVKSRRGRLFVVGYGGVVFSADAGWVWKHSRLTEGDDDSWIESLDMAPDGRVYLVGLRGEAWCSEPGGWAMITLPVNTNLHDICCGSDGNIYVCGAAGTLLVGTDDRWQVMEPPAGSAIDFWRVVEFGQRVWVSSMTHLFEWTSQGLQLQDAGAEFGLPHYYNLSSSAHGLMIVAERQVVSFDGQAASLEYGEVPR